MRHIRGGFADGPAELIVLAGALVLAAGLRFTTLDARGWWRDEAVTVELLRLPFVDLLRTIPDSEGSPPLYYVLAWGWTRLAGDSELGLRSLSALLGTVTVIVVFLAGRELVSTRTGLLAAYFAASSPLLVWHAQDGRSYALLILLAALSFLFFVRLLRTSAPADAIGFGVASALALLTHYFAVFLVVPEAVWLLARRSTRKLAIVPVAAFAVVGLALLPLVDAQRGNVSWISEVSRYRRLVEVAQEFLVGPQAPWERRTTVLAGLVVAAAIALLVWRGTRQEWWAIRPAVGMGLAALVLPLLLALTGLDYLLARNLVVAWVPLAIVVAASLATRRAGVVGIALASLIVVLGVAVVAVSASKPKFDAEDWRGAARALGPSPSGGRAIVLWPAVGLEAFRLYRPQAASLPREGATVSEVVVATFGPRRRDADVHDALFPPSPLFRPTERSDERYFTLVRYRAARPVLVSLETLASSEQGGPRPALLYEP